jgi:hypothetical protein
MVKTAYSGIQTQILLNGNLLEPFSVLNSVRQGCPLSGLLFLIVQEFYKLFIEQNNIKGIKIGKEHITVSQIADDVTFFLKNEQDLEKVLKLTNIFAKYSGLKPNIDKCEALYLGPNKNKTGHIQIKWPENPIRVIGIHICASYEEMVAENERRCIDIVETELLKWKYANLTLKGRVYVVNCHVFSKLIFTCTPLKLTETFINQVDQLTLIFYGTGKPPKYKCVH